MPRTSRRALFKSLTAGAAASPFSLASAASPGCANTAAMPPWAQGPERQRKADLGNGSYLNPIVAGDHPDPTVLKDGDDYYMRFSSFQSCPGIGIRHSTDLAEEQTWARSKTATSSVRIRLTNDRDVATWHYSHDDGRRWMLHGLRMEVSGIHHNVCGGFPSLRPAIHGVDPGKVRLRDFTYRAIEGTQA